MEKKRFEKIMDEWSSHEMKASPELSPAEEMYRRVAEKKKRSRKRIFSPFGWSIAAAAAAAVLLFIIFLPDISNRSLPLEKPSAALREGEAAHETAALRARLEPKEMEKLEEMKESGIFQQLFFQQQNRTDKSIVGFDMQTQKEERLNVTPAQNYRLQVQLNQERYVYIFQLGTDQKLTRLFPNAVYNAEQNPLKDGPLYNFPAPPQWLSVNEAAPGGTIYVVAANQPQPNWDRLMGQYDTLKSKNRQQEMAAQFVEELESLSAKQEPGVEVFKFVFQRP